MADTDSGNSDEIVELGGNIELSGFRDVDGGTMIILKKIVGNYVKQFSERVDGFERLQLNMKDVHKTEGSVKYSISANLIVNGKTHNAELTDRNIFTTIDKVLKKVESGIK